MSEFEIVKSYAEGERERVLERASLTGEYSWCEPDFQATLIASAMGKYFEFDISNNENNLLPATYAWIQDNQLKIAFVRPKDFYDFKTKLCENEFLVNGKPIVVGKFVKESEELMNFKLKPLNPKIKHDLLINETLKILSFEFKKKTFSGKLKEYIYLIGNDIDFNTNLGRPVYEFMETVQVLPFISYMNIEKIPETEEQFWD